MAWWDPSTWPEQDGKKTDTLAFEQLMRCVEEQVAAWRLGEEISVLAASSARNSLSSQPGSSRRRLVQDFDSFDGQEEQQLPSASGSTSSLRGGSRERLPKAVVAPSSISTSSSRASLTAGGGGPQRQSPRGGGIEYGLKRHDLIESLQDLRRASAAFPTNPAEREHLSTNASRQRSSWSAYQKGDLVGITRGSWAAPPRERGARRAGAGVIAGEPERFVEAEAEGDVVIVGDLRGQDLANLPPSGRRMPQWVRDLARTHRLPAAGVEEVFRIFKSFDEDDSGEIEFGEFLPLLRRLMRLPKSDEIPESRAQKFWRELDRDGSGGVDFGEFLVWYAKYFLDSDEEPASREGKVVNDGSLASMLEKTLTSTTDNEDALRAQAIRVRFAMENAEQAGAARHATLCVFERVYQATWTKAENLRQLREAREVLEQFEEGTVQQQGKQPQNQKKREASEEEAEGILEFRKVLENVAHPSVPKEPTDGLHPNHRQLANGRTLITNALELFARDLHAFAKSTRSCDEIEQKISYALKIGVAKGNSNIVESQRIANSLREQERLAQRKAQSEERQNKLKGAAGAVTAMGKLGKMAAAMRAKGGGDGGGGDGSAAAAEDVDGGPGASPSPAPSLSASQQGEAVTSPSPT